MEPTSVVEALTVFACRLTVGAVCLFTPLSIEGGSYEGEPRFSTLRKLARALDIEAQELHPDAD